MTLSELRTKEVIDVQDGRRLGKVMDLEFSVEDSRITALVVPSRELLSAIPARRKMRAGHSLGGRTPHRRRCDSGHDPLLSDYGLGCSYNVGRGIALPARAEKTAHFSRHSSLFLHRKTRTAENRLGFDF